MLFIILVSSFLGDPSWLLSDIESKGIAESRLFWNVGIILWDAAMIIDSFVKS